MCVGTLSGVSSEFTSHIQPPFVNPMYTVDISVSFMNSK